jgi:hypothetical protein
MKSFRIVLEYTCASDFIPTEPSRWDWHELIAAEADETVSLVDVQEIETPEGHLEDLKDAQ